MYCRKCGTKNDDNAFKCVNCGEVIQPAATSAPPPIQEVPNYLVQAILVTLFCCLPFGIVSIVYAAQVNSKSQAGDYQGALESSQKAKKWCWVSFWVGVGIYLLYLIAVIIGVILEQT